MRGVNSLDRWRERLWSVTEENQGDQEAFKKFEGEQRTGSGVGSANMATNFYDLSANLLTGEAFDFSCLRGKVVLIENVASL